MARREQRGSGPTACLHLNGCPGAWATHCARLRKCLLRELQCQLNAPVLSPTAVKASGRPCQEGGEFEAGGASCPPCTGRRDALSQLCSFHIATYSPATQASRRAEGGDGGVRGSQEAAPTVPGLPQLRAGRDLFTPRMATRRQCPKDYIPLHSVKQASQ